MQRYLAPRGALLLIIMSLATWAKAGTVRETEFYNFQNGLSPRGALTVVYCGQNDENGVIYYTPAPIATTAPPAMGDATCDGLDGATEATQDANWSTNVNFRPI